MTRLLRRVFAAAAFLLCSTAFAASAPLSNEMLAPLTAAYMRAVKPGPDAEMHRELFANVLARIERTYVREVDMPTLIGIAQKTIEANPAQSGDPGEVFKKAMNAALASLDPHSRYLDARAQTSQISAISGSYGGLGLSVDMSDGLIRVVEPTPGAPAARAGLQRGDLIMRFDGQTVLGMTLPDAIARMRGQAGTPILLTIRREGRADDFNVQIVRETIRTQALTWRMDGDVLVLRLSTFTGTVAAALEKAIEEATAKSTPRAVVLDMRGNGGGLLTQAVRTADAFLGKGDIVSLRGRTPGNQKSWQADVSERLAGVPMVVLVDGRSASATELVAAALQENGRAIVMGQRSFGKGSVQTIVPLGGDRGALKLTTALYHGPSGRTVQRTGVGPDIELVPSSERAAKREADRVQALPGADEPLPPKARVEESRCAKPGPQADPALACAIAYLHAGAIDRFVSSLEPPQSAALD